MEQHAELVTLERLAEPSLSEQAGDRLRVHGLVEQLVPRAAAALGAVHRGVGVAQEARGAIGGASVIAIPMLAVTTTSACASANGWRAPDRAVGDLFDLALVGEVLADHDELVAAESRHGVLAADGVGEAAAHRDEQLVARVVTEAVVDDLEAVEVEEEHRDHGVPSPSRASAASSRSTASARLGRSVSVSCSAR